MIFMLDTNICICLMNRRIGFENILMHLDGLKNNQVIISSITIAELQYGIAKSVKKETNKFKLLYFLHQFECVPFDTNATDYYGNIRSHLELVGTPIGALDMLIAAHALSLSAIIVTNNVREFERVEGLQIENWTKEQ
jgi:tRNA(fMet)-specific endonuclease VapC